MIISNVAKIIKGQPLAEIQNDASVKDACKVMCQLDARALVVLKDSELVGVLSERDVITKCICEDKRTSETPVAEVMTDSPASIDADGSLAEALEIMGNGGFHHLPVLSNDKPVGLLSIDDIPEEYRMMLERFKEMRNGH